MSKSTSARPKRRIALPALIAGGAASLILALSMSPTVAAFSASITNSASVGTGALVMQETDASGNVICSSTDGEGVSTNKATCSTLDEWGGNSTLVPGQPVGVDLQFKNAGTVAATKFTLQVGDCTQTKPATPGFHGNATDLCSKLNVTIKSGSTVVYQGSAAQLATSTKTTGLSILNVLGKTTVAPNTSIPLNISVTLDQSADNSYAGLKASQALTWTFNS